MNITRWLWRGLGFALLLIVFTTGLAQGIPATIAPFEITLANGKVFTATQLIKNKPTVLIYFDPDCEHCVLFTKELLKRSTSIKDKQVVMVTYQPMGMVQSFNKNFGLSSYPNIKMGTELETFVVRKYYGVTTFPFVALYKANGKAAGIYNKGMNDANAINNMIKTIATLK